jgi:cholesterol transport system auxiliary component
VRRGERSRSAPQRAASRAKDANGAKGAKCAKGAKGAIDRRTILSIALPLVFPFGLAACSSSPPDSFDLASAPVQTPRQPRNAVISIDEPSAAPLIDSNRVVIRRPDTDIAYLAGAQWSDQLTRLVQRRVIQSFESARLFRAVAETGTAADYILAMDIRKFEIDGATNTAQVEIAVRLLAARTGHTLQGTVVTGSAPAPTSGAQGITHALDVAFGEAADKILRFAASRT